MPDINGLELVSFLKNHPVYKTIPSMVISADLVLRSLTDDYEIIVVNDGSSDHTAAMLAELEAKYPRLRVVTHVKNGPAQYQSHSMNVFVEGKPAVSHGDRSGTSCPSR